MNARRLSIARDFSRFPAGRYKEDGKFPGEVCRRRLLLPALKAGGDVIIDLRGTLGYGSSFLEEAFGGLVREEGISANDLHRQVSFISDDEALEAEIWSYIDTAATQVAHHA